jgi:uncharacterized protein GlcG (DUF336 family)
MRVIFRSIVGAVLLAGIAGARAQGVVTQRILSLNAARVIAEGALAECAARGFRTSVAVVDRAGNLLVVLRDERAHPVTLDMARGKAYTAVAFRGSTLEFQERTANDPQLTPQRDVPGILALAGGVPILVDGEILGAVASSGSNQPTDDACARAGIAKAQGLLQAP